MTIMRGLTQSLQSWHVLRVIVDDPLVREENQQVVQCFAEALGNPYGEPVVSANRSNPRDACVAKACPVELGTPSVLIWLLAIELSVQQPENDEAGSELVVPGFPKLPVLVLAKIIVDELVVKTSLDEWVGYSHPMKIFPGDIYMATKGSVGSFFETAKIVLTLRILHFSGSRSFIIKCIAGG